MEKVTLDSLSPTPIVMKISLLAFKIVTKSGKYSKIYFSLGSVVVSVLIA